jgi:hypothetical protein
MDAEELTNVIADLLENDEYFGELRIDTFRDAGVITNDDGLVLQIEGREFQITIVRSK